MTSLYFETAEKRFKAVQKSVVLYVLVTFQKIEMRVQGSQTPIRSSVWRASATLQKFKGHFNLFSSSLDV